MENIFIRSREDLKKFLKYEKKFYLKNTKKEKLMKLFFLKNEKFILWSFQKKLRKLEYHMNNNHNIRSLLLKSSLVKYKKIGLLIPPNTCDMGLHIMHIGSILINDKVRIGKNCRIHINVAIVAEGNSNSAPVIGDEVVIGVGAKIVGDIYIANYCAIGAGAVVTKSFREESSTIVGVPAKIINYNGSKYWKRK